jgi:hypothetical protein
MDARRLSKDRSFAPRRRHIELDGGDAFVPDFRRGFVPVRDGDAEAFGEEFIAAATSAEGMGEAARDELVEEDFGGLVVETSFEEAAES